MILPVVSGNCTYHQWLFQSNQTLLQKTHFCRRHVKPCPCWQSTSIYTQVCAREIVMSYRVNVTTRNRCIRHAGSLRLRYITWFILVLFSNNTSIHQQSNTCYSNEWGILQRRQSCPSDAKVKTDDTATSQHYYHYFYRCLLHYILQVGYTLYTEVILHYISYEPKAHF